jgi:hypothetical protein
MGYVGYRLHAFIPNVSGYNKELELGKQYDVYAWDDFNAKWFGAFNDAGLIGADNLLEFYEEFLDANSNAAEYPLYNVDALKEMIDHAVKNGYDMYFVSY